MSSRGRALLGIAVLSAVALLIAQECTARVFADEPDGPRVGVGERPEPSLYPVQLEYGLILLVAGPRDAVWVPYRFAVESVGVAQCESRWQSDAVGAAGELGILQVNPIHAPAMAKHGLDFQSAGDRVRWAVRMWEAGGREWGPWACGGAVTKEWAGGTE